MSHEIKSFVEDSLSSTFFFLFSFKKKMALTSAHKLEAITNEFILFFRVRVKKINFYRFTLSQSRLGDVVRCEQKKD
jgi:hypothetical protein